MREQKQVEGRGGKTEQDSFVGSDSQLPILASVRTGLAGKEEAILRRIPMDYSGRSVRETIDYIVGADLKDSELALAESVKKELGARGSVVVANGKTVKLDDKLDKYLVEREHELPGGAVRKYRELEIEISAVQQGGLYNLLR